MKIVFAKDAYDHYCYWKANDDKVFQKINHLVKAIKNDPFKGIGKPEPLKGNLSGYWSRRITQEHRLVYKVSGTPPDQKLTVIQCKFHY